MKSDMSVCRKRWECTQGWVKEHLLHVLLTWNEDLVLTELVVRGA